MSASILGLPPIPADLKTITPYLQRADELKSQDPVVSYWCAYYAAQVGIALKARSNPARDLLFALLNALEHMKAAIGPNDAIDIESVSSAYLENFALRIFANADNEDRGGRATRSTAKKFLAAANFLEVLRTFPKSDISESNEDKIRYAKWKAGDIAKAFREGRKPAPGPPGWEEEQEELRALQQQQKNVHIPSPPESHLEISSHQSNFPPNVTSISSPRSSHISSSHPRHSPTSHPHTGPFGNPENPSAGWSKGIENGPETWSTTSTPGLDAPSDGYTIGIPTPSTAGFDHNSIHPSTSGISKAKQHWDATEGSRTKKRSGSGSSSNAVSSNGTKGNCAWTSEELGGKQTPSTTPPKSSFKSGSPDSDKKVHFSPSTIGAPPPPQPHINSGSPKEYLGPSSIYAPSTPSTPVDIYQSHSITHPPVQTPPSLLPTSSPPRAHIYTPPPPPPPPTQVSPTRVSSQNQYPSTPTKPAFELTPSVIAKAQKHCRFAISSLDYEDAEQARKELRAALALLGG